MIKLELTLEEINTVLSALGNAPYIQVFNLITKLKDQASPQVPQSPAPASVPSYDPADE